MYIVRVGNLQPFARIHKSWTVLDCNVVLGLNVEFRSMSLVDGAYKHTHTHTHIHTHTHTHTHTHAHTSHTRSMGTGTCTYQVMLYGLSLGEILYLTMKTMMSSWYKQKQKKM